MTVCALAFGEDTLPKSCTAALDAHRSLNEITLAVGRVSDGIRTDLTIVIPSSAISVKSHGKSWRASLRWFVVQRNNLGKRFGEVWTGMVQLVMTAEALRQFQEKGYTIQQRLVPSDTAGLHVIVCDLQSGRVGTYPVHENHASASAREPE
jgi:hypothetical protein